MRKGKLTLRKVKERKLPLRKIKMGPFKGHPSEHSWMSDRLEHKA